MTKDLTTIIEEWIEKDYYIIDGVRVKDGMEGVHNECLDHLKSKIPQLVEEIVGLIKLSIEENKKETLWGSKSDNEVMDISIENFSVALLESLTGKNI